MLKIEGRLTEIWDVLPGKGLAREIRLSKNRISDRQTHQICPRTSFSFISGKME